MRAAYLTKGLAGLGAVAALVGCHTDMWVQPKTDPQEPSEFHTDRLASRPLVQGTVARDHLREDEAFFTGRRNGKLVTEIPMPLDAESRRELLKRGQERFNIYCSPCHGRAGDGHGMITQRGLQLRRPPANYHTDRLRQMPIGHFYEVMTNGYGVMFSYAARVEPQDRWAIAAYIRALQLSQHATPADLSPEEMQQIRQAASQPAVSGRPMTGEATNE